jgi:cysteine desulfurase/selenocysteine lyase
LTHDGRIDLDAAARMLTPAHKLVAFAHVSNVLGSVLDVKRAADLAHGVGAKLLIDGCQAAPRIKLDMAALDCDFYVFSGHKLYGPTGIGVLYGKYDLLAEMQPYQGGGEMIDVVTLDEVTYNTPPHRFEAGTPPIVQAIGLGAAIDYVEAIGRDALTSHEADLTAYGTEGLSRINSLRLIGNAPGKGGIFSFEIEGAHAHDVSTILDRYGIAVRAGTHCAMPLLKRFGVTSTCRASLGLYSGKDDIDALVDGIEKARTFFR